MTQPPRTTETINRDNATIRDILTQARERLTVPDRATLAVGLIGHLATFMNRRQMEKLFEQLHDEAERVQDVPPMRRREPEKPRPYRAWGHPWTTGLALVGSVLFLAGAVASDTVNSLYALALLAVSYPVFRVIKFLN